MSYLKDREDAWIKEQMKLDRNREKKLLNSFKMLLMRFKRKLKLTGIDFPMAKRLRLAKQEKWLIRWT